MELVLQIAVGVFMGQLFYNVLDSAIQSHIQKSNTKRTLQQLRQHRGPIL